MHVRWVRPPLPSGSGGRVPVKELTSLLWAYRQAGGVPLPATRTFVLAPYAGGSMYSMRGLAEHLVGPGEQAFLLQYPGRGPRSRERPSTSLAALAGEAAADIRQHGQGRIVLFGHSLGGHLCFEIADRLEAAGWQVDLLVISSARAPRFRSLRASDVLEMTDEEWIHILAAEYSHGHEALSSPELLSMAIRALRSDYLLLALHQWRNRVVGCPMLIVGGDADHDVTADHLRGWEELTTGPAETVVLNGNHFYYREREAELRDVIRARQPMLSARGAWHAVRGSLPHRGSAETEMEDE